MRETGLLWLDLTNIALGVAALVPLVLLVVAILSDIRRRPRRRTAHAPGGGRLI